MRDEPRHVHFIVEIPDRSAHAAYLGMLERPFEELGRRARHRCPAGGHRGVAHPRKHHHGAFRQAGLDHAHHRQQERVRHRLCHPLRRHVRRLRGDQGRTEDSRLRPLPLPQPRHSAGDPRASSKPPERRAQTRSARSGHWLPPYDILDAVIRAVRGERSQRPGDRRPGLRPRDRGPHRADDQPQRVQAPSVPARGQDHPKGVRKGPRPAHCPQVRRPVVARGRTRRGVLQVARRQPLHQPR